MSGNCDLCGKSLLFGHNVSHSKRATNRHWRVNLQKVRIQKGSTTASLKICSRCLRTLRKTS
jgi:large subunit ribosomal protein L28